MNKREGAETGGEERGGRESGKVGSGKFFRWQEECITVHIWVQFEKRIEVGVHT